MRHEVGVHPNADAGTTLDAKSTSDGNGASDASADASFPPPQVQVQTSPSGSMPGDVFAYTIPGSTFGLGADTSLDTGWNLGDAFGARLSTPEEGNIIFPDQNPIGASSTLTVHLASPVAITRYTLWVM